MAGTVTIVDDRATWPADFQGIAAGLRSAYGATALRIDHPPPDFAGEPAGLARRFFRAAPTAIPTPSCRTRCSTC